MSEQQKHQYPEEWTEEDIKLHLLTRSLLPQITYMFNTELDKAKKLPENNPELERQNGEYVEIKTNVDENGNFIDKTIN